MHSTAFDIGCHVSPAILPVATPPHPRLEIQSVFEEHGAMYAMVRYGVATRMIVVEPPELESWNAFAACLHREGIQARHPQRGWRSTVTSAVQRGSA
jgi:hypothetical protein